MTIKCRLCHSDDLFGFLDLGYHPPSDQFLKPEQLDEPVTYYPLRLVRCNECSFVQLDHVVDPKILYQNDYPYMSSTTEAGRKHFDEFSGKIVEKFDLQSDDLVIDVGSNVGVLLGGFKNRGIKVLGIDPAPNIVKIAEQNGIRTIVDFFGHQCGDHVVEKFGKAKIITASNVFAHIDDLHSVMEDVKTVLEDDGVFIIEAPYLQHLIDNLEYDTIYHEHLSYLSLSPLKPFFEKLGYEIFDIDLITIHGGSLRVYIAKKGQHKIQPIVGELLQKETDSKIHETATLQKFAQDVAKNRETLLSLIRDLKKQGKKIAAVSAPAKGMTLLNYCGLSREDLLFATEKCELKVGRFTPGGNLLVKTDRALIDSDIDYAILLSWNFKDEIIKNLSFYSENGGKFIIPIPTPTIV
ncbi:MAG: class I SAM-dependent methyltransferase [SAR324 cluster bacterium]|nr:class I SAM-dependent methyltransferase [SAR324 cluster bacterium]